MDTYFERRIAEAENEIKAIKSSSRFIANAKFEVEVLEYEIELLNKMIQERVK